VPKPPRRQANQIAIARAAGVSVSTVSRALSNAPGISEERRSQIRKLAQDAGYFGRSAMPAATRTLLTYVTASIATGGLAPFYEAVVAGLAAGAADAGLVLAVRLVDENNFDLRRVRRDNAELQAIATLLVGIDPRPEIGAHYLERGDPLVLVNGYDPSLRFDCVAPNNFYGGALATRRLIDAGHRSLLYVEDHIRWTTIQRRRGFLAAIEERPEIKGRVLPIRPDREARLGAEIGRRKRGETDWTAVFTVNDTLAIQVMGALETAGLRVPDDVSVVGFDDLLYAAMISPPLSTMTVDCTALGRQAIALLLRRLAEPTAVPVQVDCAVHAKSGSTIALLAQL
jgi:LacI family transcriptional regulator, repressor for deo operon, udp, cdd, tsx, nupC, and nupG